MRLRLYSLVLALGIAVWGMGAAEVIPGKPPEVEGTRAETAASAALTQPSLYAAGLALTADERAFLAEHPVLRVGNEPDWPPYDFFENGVPQGYSVDLMHLIAHALGVRFEFIRGSRWDELIDMLCNRQIDLLQPADRPQKLRDCALFSRPIIQESIQFLTRRDHPPVRSLADLYGSRVASPRGWEQTEFLKNRFGDRFSIIETENIQEAIAAVNNGEADFTADLASSLNYHIARSGYVNLRVQGVWGWKERGGEFATLYIAIRDDWPILQSIIDKALASITHEQIRRLQDKWFGGSDQRLALSPTQLDYLVKKSRLRMCVHPNWAPLEWINKEGQHEGIIADLMARLAELLDVRLALIPTASWDESLALIREGRCDLLPGVPLGPRREPSLSYTKPYLSFRSVIATQAGQPFINDFNSILDRELGIVQGAPIAFTLRSYYPEIRLQEVEDIDTGLRLVREGRLFGVIDMLPTIAYRLQTQGLSDLKIAGQLEIKEPVEALPFGTAEVKVRGGAPIDLDWQLAIATRADEPLLREVFEAALAAFPPPQRQAIVNHWLSTRREQVVDYALMGKVIAAVVGVSGLILGLLMVWNRRLARLNLELEQARAEIAAHNLELEHRVAERTRDLREALERLERTQAQLVQSEKLAALGDLVAGIAHELNTPIGNAVMLTSTLADQERAFREQMAGGLSRSALQRFVDGVREGSDLLLRNLQRAAELISSFKQLAVDQASYQRRTFKLDELIREVALTLQPRLRRLPVRLELAIDPGIRLDSFPGPLGQVLMNLIQNALIHAFDEGTAGCIRIQARSYLPERVLIRVSDDGKGIPPEHLDRIFDPFFTTRLGQGGSGLGLHIVYNLVTRLLGGTIAVRSQIGQGTTFTIDLPLVAPVAGAEGAEREDQPKPEETASRSAHQYPGGPHERARSIGGR